MQSRVILLGIIKKISIKGIVTCKIIIRKIKQFSPSLKFKKNFIGKKSWN